ncbi:MAG: exodeoxyribonuclease VII large subunit [Gammaproteobacteria bacterium]|nr:exodeoxyribonuclease VII large subunit [Gammaproteobacteria bacterium]
MPFTTSSDYLTRLPDEMPGAGVLSVSSLNSLARSLLESNFPAVLVEGEISNLATPASGHWYLTLKDQKSQIRCAMFRGSNQRIRFKPNNGMQILAKGRLSIYEGRGDYQLIIDEMEEAGDGALRKAFELLKGKLAEAGLFDAERKQPVSDSFRHIGVITSASGAAIRDILSVFARRFPSTQITLLPVTVQGKEAAREIAHAIELANKLADKLNLEALIVGRGGGSLEDLQAFNEEVVARAIGASALPIVSAVGHEIDFTIADFVADLRAPTPSAAAELLSPDQEEYRQSFSSYQQQISGTITQKFKQARQQIAWLGKRLRHPGRRLQDHAQGLDLLENRLNRATQQRIQQHRNKLRELRRTLSANSPRLRIVQFQISQKNYQQRLLQATKHRVKESADYLNQLSRSLNAVSPLSTLGRGYSITYDKSDEVLKNSDDVKKGDHITTHLNKGRIVSSVIAIKPTRPQRK